MDNRPYVLLFEDDSVLYMWNLERSLKEKHSYISRYFRFVYERDPYIYNAFFKFLKKNQTGFHPPQITPNNQVLIATYLMQLIPQNQSPSIRVSRPHHHCGPDMLDQSYSPPLCVSQAS